MGNNKLIIAAAGSGKTTFLITEAIKHSEKKVLITTYTQANEAEIKKKIIEKINYIPENITVQTWFSFLLKHGVRPYQGIVFDKRINGLILVNNKSALYVRKSETEKYYFIDVAAYSKLLFLDLKQPFIDALTEYYYLSKRFYLEREFTYTSFTNIVRQICKHGDIKFESEIKYSHSKYYINFFVCHTP